MQTFYLMLSLLPELEEGLPISRRGRTHYHLGACGAENMNLRKLKQLCERLFKLPIAHQTFSAKAGAQSTLRSLGHDDEAVLGRLELQVGRIACFSAHFLTHSTCHCCNVGRGSKQDTQGKRKQGHFGMYHKKIESRQNEMEEYQS